MSKSYLVLSYPETDWQIQVKPFRNALKERWPSIQFIPIVDPQDPYLLEWTIAWEDGSQLHGFLDKDLQTIVLKGGGAGLEECAEFAVWFQSQYPERKDFIFFDDGPNFDLYLYGLTEEQILHKAQAGSSVWFPEKSHSGEIPSCPLDV